MTAVKAVKVIAASVSLMLILASTKAQQTKEQTSAHPSTTAHLSYQLHSKTTQRSQTLNSLI